MIDRDFISAREFARDAHEGQTRKYNGEPYFNHLQRVADRVYFAHLEVHGATFNDKMVIAAYLHDVVEDTDVTIFNVQEKFGDKVAGMVYSLTNVPPTSGLNRQQRHALDAIRLANASYEAKTVKIADILDNTRDIDEFDNPVYAQQYLREKLDLLGALIGGNSGLHAKAVEQVKSKIKGNK